MAHNLEDRPRTNDILLKDTSTFNSLFLPEQISLGLKDAGFIRPSPIQLKAIPLGRCGLDMIVQAKSGTGKTLVFTILALETIDLRSSAVQVVILAPTREIAVQIEDVTKSLGKHFAGLHTSCFIGGLPIEDDIKNLSKCHIAIGAPGRMKSLIEKKYLKTKAVRLLILDEADKLMEESFKADINYIYNHLPTRKQVLALSATYPGELKDFLANYMHSPTFVSPEAENPLLLGLQQFITVVKESNYTMQQIDIKTKELIRLLSNISFTQCVVFFNFQTRAETLSHMLRAQGWNAKYISGGQPQKERLKVISSLKNFDCRILLTTDLTARGIDASNVDLVVNFEVPFEAATYLHRMGRAGRYGSHGLCVTICSDGKELHDFQKLLGQIGGADLKIPRVPELLGNIWTCSLSELNKVESIVTEDNVDMKRSIVDLKSVYQNLQKLKVSDVEDKNNDEVGNKSTSQLSDDMTTAPEAEPSTESGDCVSAQVLYPWIPVETSVLLKPSGKNLLDNDTHDETAKKRKGTDNLSNEAKLTCIKNIALYKGAQLLASNDLKLTEQVSESVGNYLNVLQEETKRHEGEMEKFFEGYSCDDILKNLAQHTDAWNNTSSVVAPITDDSLPQTIDKENIFRIGYDSIVKNAIPWADGLSDCCSSASEENQELNYEEDSAMEEESVGAQDFNNTAVQFPYNGFTYGYPPPRQYTQLGIYDFQLYYDRRSQELSNYAGTFADEASANEWYDTWRSQLYAVTNFVQQNIETLEKSHYQYYYHAV